MPAAPLPPPAPLRPAFPLALGCMEMGNRADAAASAALFAATRAAGISHFDTAHLYAGGESERLLGRLIAPGREALTLATKLGYTGGAGRANLLAQFDESRRRLGVDAVDLLYLHRPDPDTPVEETLGVLAGLQARGLVRWLGLSNHAAWQVMRAQAAAARLGTRIDAIQPMYSLVKRQAEVELLPMAADQGMVAFTYSPLGGGLLTGKYAAGAGTGRLADDPRYAARYAPGVMHAAAAGLAALAAETGHAPATLAVAWLLSRPGRVVPLVAGRDAAQLAPVLAAATLPLPAALAARIGALFPAPPPATDRLDEAAV